MFTLSINIISFTFNELKIILFAFVNDSLLDEFLDLRQSLCSHLRD